MVHGLEAERAGFEPYHSMSLMKSFGRGLQMKMYRNSADPGAGNAGKSAYALSNGPARHQQLCPRIKAFVGLRLSGSGKGHKISAACPTFTFGVQRIN